MRSSRTAASLVLAGFVAVAITSVPAAAQAPDGLDRDGGFTAYKYDKAADRRWQDEDEDGDWRDDSRRDEAEIGDDERDGFDRRGGFKDDTIDPYDRPDDHVVERQPLDEDVRYADRERGAYDEVYEDDRDRHPGRYDRAEPRLGTHIPGIIRRLRRQNRRIRAGLDDGLLTRDELDRIRVRIERIESALRRARSGGEISWRERRRIHRMLKRSSRLIARLKQNNDAQFSNYEHRRWRPDE